MAEGQQLTSSVSEGRREEEGREKLEGLEELPGLREEDR